MFYYILSSYGLMDPSIHSSIIISTSNATKENVFTISRGCLSVADELHQLLVTLEPVVTDQMLEP